MDDLAGRVLHNENSYFSDKDEAETKDVLKRALVAFLNMSEVQHLVESRGSSVSDTEWSSTAESRSLAMDNAVLGIAEMLHNGAIDESSVLYLKDTQVLSVNNYEDLSTIMTMTAKAALDTFIDAARLTKLKHVVEGYAQKAVAKLSSVKTPKGLKVKTTAAPNQSQIAAVNNNLASIKKTVDDLIAARTAVTDNLKTTVESGADLKSELQKISNSTRTFRYTLDQHVKRKGEGFGTKVRRFFSNIFFRDSKASVSKADFKKIQSLEQTLQKQLEELKFMIPSSAGRTDNLSFANVATLSKESGDLTHIANSLLRNCSKKVDKSYVAYTERAHEIFDKALNADSSSGTGVKTIKMTCKLGAELALEFGIGSGKAGVDVQREIEVMLHPGGAVSMRLATGVGVHGDVAIGPGSAKAKAAYMQGRVLTYDSFDKFVAAAYGKLALPVTKDEKNERVDGTLVLKGKDVKFLGDTSGNAAKRLFRSIGFLEFGTRVDTEFFLKSLRSKGVDLSVTALIDGLDSNQ